MPQKVPTAREFRIALFLTAALLLFGNVLIQAVNFDPTGFDFAEFYTAGTRIDEGRGHNLYDVKEHFAAAQRIFHHDVPLYNHLPAEAISFALLARLPYLWAYVVWGVLNVVLWAVFAYRIQPLVPLPPLQFLLLAGLFFPLWGALSAGQSSVMVMAAYALSLRSLADGKEGWAGFFLGLGMLKFQFTLPLAAIFFLRGRWRVIAGCAISSALLAVLSLAVCGFDGCLAYVRLLREAVAGGPVSNYFDIQLWRMSNIKEFVSHFMSGHFGGTTVSVVVAALSLALILAVAWRWRREDRAGRDQTAPLMFAAALSTVIVVATHVYTYDFSAMLPGILVVAGSLSRVKGVTRAVGLAAVIALYAVPLYLLLAAWHALYWMAPVLVALTFVALRIADAPASQLNPSGGQV